MKMRRHRAKKTPEQREVELAKMRERVARLRDDRHVEEIEDLKNQLAEARHAGADRCRQVLLERQRRITRATGLDYDVEEEGYKMYDEGLVRLRKFLRDKKFSYDHLAGEDARKSNQA